MALEAIGLRRRIARRWVVDGVDLKVHRGEIVGLLGPNGAGKTVTFSMIVGILTPTEGRIVLEGTDITRLPLHQRARRGVIYLPQERSVFHGLTATDNIAGVLEMRGAKRYEARRRAHDLLEDLGLTHVADTPAVRLSGGEQRRLEVGRCLAMDPHYLLVDEPFAGVDPITIETLQQMLSSLRARDIGILITDHNVMETLALCDRAYVLFDGRLLANGAPNELRTNDAVQARFLGQPWRKAFPDTVDILSLTDPMSTHR
jgi:lipopolysaccharide export system ATP-binding protein